MDLKKLTAPCGLPCFACAYYKENITEEAALAVANMIGVKPEEIPCAGCRSEKGCSFEMPLTNGKGCDTKNCVEKKGLHNCSECNEMPCENLMPVLDNAGNAPHNTKLYNLCRIRLMGLDAWTTDEAAMIQQKYFKGKFAYGRGPILEDDKN